MSVSKQPPAPPHDLPPRDTRLGWLFVALQFVLLGVLVVEMRAAGQTAPLQRTLGVLAATAGATAMGFASRRLGRELRTHPAPSSTAVLRVDGPYRFVRHPIYAGLLLLAAGLAAIGGTAPAVAAFIALLALLSLKARFEERLLAERFPGYPEYARRTPRFVPRLPRSPHRG